MKYSIIFLYSLLASVIFINASCEKEKPSRRVSQSPPLPPPPPTSSNQSIWADVNYDVTIELPMNFAVLNGSVYGPGGNGAKVKWEKISGPAAYIIASSDTIVARVSNLEIGVYQFKFTATSSSGETVSDMMNLKVQNATASRQQIVFSNVNWTCPWGCGVYLGYVSYFLPSNNSFTVYIRREGSQNWELVVPDVSSITAKYSYWLQDGQLSVFDNSFLDAADHPEIKIVF